MILCKDCRWCERPACADAHCLHPQATYKSTNVVSGEVKARRFFCELFRGFSMNCGPEAKLFEPKP